MVASSTFGYMRGVTHYFVVSGAVALTLALALACKTRNSEGDLIQAPPSTEDSSPLVTWSSDRSYDYELKLESQLDLQQGGSLIELSVTAPLSVVPRASSPQQIDLLITLLDPLVEGEGNEDGIDFSTLKSELALPFVVSLRDGQMVQLQHRGGISLFAVSIQRTLGAALQLSPRPGALAEWTAEEFDATGKYAARYERLPDPGEYRRQKQRYLGTSAETRKPSLSVGLADLQPSLIPEVLKAETVYALVDDTPQSIRHREQLRMNTLPGAAPIDSMTTLQLTRNGVRQGVPIDWVEETAGLVTLKSEEGYRDPRTPKLDEARIGSWTFDTALAELEKLERDSEPLRGKQLSESEKVVQQQLSQRTSSVFRALTAILRKETEAQARAVTAIKAGNAAARMLLDALSSSNSASAQQHLIAISNDVSFPKALRKQAASSLLRVQEPSPELIQALERWLSQGGWSFVHAGYGLGSVARKLRERGEVAESQRLSSLLLQRLQAARSKDEQLTLLRGIANSAYLGAVDTVRPFLDSEDSGLRLASVQALRLMQAPEVDELIAARLKAERLAKVRKVIVDDLERRSPSPPLVAAARILGLEGEEQRFRLEAVRLMSAWLPASPELTPTLQTMARQDVDEKVRAAAQRALGG